MIKMLQDDPRLAKHKDFISGYTALHWAAKHGKFSSSNFSHNMNVIGRAKGWLFAPRWQQVRAISENEDN
jgi:hypothetical protein